MERGERHGLALGIGCRSGTPASLLARGVAEVLGAHGFTLGDVRGVASVDRKREEAGLLALSVERGWPLALFSSDELSAVSARREPTAATRIGARAVAEPAALLLARGGPLVVPHTPYAGCMTLAAARWTARDG